MRAFRARGWNSKVAVVTRAHKDREDLAAGFHTNDIVKRERADLGGQDSLQYTDTDRRHRLRHFHNG